MTTMNDLKRECVKYNLTEFLKKCTCEELQDFIGLIQCNDIIGINAKIYDALLTEMEYRQMMNTTNLYCNEIKSNMFKSQKTKKKVK